MEYVRNELSTIDGLLSDVEPQTEKIFATIEELKRMLDRTTT